MGACNFMEFVEGFDPKSAFEQRHGELTDWYGDDPYNGTMSTCDLQYRYRSDVPVITEVYLGEESEKLAREYAENDDWGEKWYARVLDLGEMPDEPDIHMFAFYGWAAM